MADNDDAVPKTENSRENPTWLAPYQFKPGESGNPGGRPAKPLTQRLLARLFESDESMTKELVEAWIAKALSGDIPALREMLDRTEGKVADKQEHTGADGGPIETSISVKFV